MVGNRVVIQGLLQSGEFANHRTDEVNALYVGGHVKGVPKSRIFAFAPDIPNYGNAAPAWAGNPREPGWIRNP